MIKKNVLVIGCILSILLFLARFSIAEAKQGENPQGILDHFMDGYAAIIADESLGEVRFQAEEFFNFFMTQVSEGPNLSQKTKEFIALGIGVYNRCKYCIITHVYMATLAGANRAEIMEAAMVGIAFGGGPSLAYTSTLVKDALDVFQPSGESISPSNYAIP